jgi:hypothetical protein
VKALPLVERIFHLPYETLDALLEDCLIDDLGRIAASVCEEGSDLLQRIVVDASVCHEARLSAIHGINTLVAAGHLSRLEALEFYGKLLENDVLSSFDEDPSGTCVSIISRANRLAPVEIETQIRNAFDSGRMEEGWIDWEDVKKAIETGWNPDDPDFKHDHEPMSDVIKEIGSWGCFGPHARSAGAAGDVDLVGSEEGARFNAMDRTGFAPLEEARPPTKRTAPKVGRNDPCPCGSGNKYKRCCLKK